MFSLIREIPWFLPRPLIENSTGDKKRYSQNPAVKSLDVRCQDGQKIAVRLARRLLLGWPGLPQIRGR